MVRACCVAYIEPEPVLKSSHQTIFDSVYLKSGFDKCFVCEREGGRAARRSRGENAVSYCIGIFSC